MQYFKRLIKGMLGMDIFRGSDKDPSNALVEMLHSCTPFANIEKILLSFQAITGTIRLFIATIAFGMGVDCKGVHRVFQYWPAKNVESYIQETGRAGRAGTQSAVYILYHGILLAHVDGQRSLRKPLRQRCCQKSTILIWKVTKNRVWIPAIFKRGRGIKNVTCP